MKIIDKIKQLEIDGKSYWSFEYFPPKTETGIENLYKRIEKMSELNPQFIDITWGAGGSTSELTLDLSSNIQSSYKNIDVCMHLTCKDMSRDKIDLILQKAKNSGIENILALRGDSTLQAVRVKNNEFNYAIDLVKYIRKQYGDYFCIGVAGYPEGHVDCIDIDTDIKFLKEKILAGADFIITQLFYDADIYLNWLDKIRKNGIHVPVIPGIMPIQNYNGFKKMTTLCKTFIPNDIHKDLELIKDDDQAVKDYGINLSIKMCNKLKKAGQLGIHFYTLNLERSTTMILEKINQKYTKLHSRKGRFELWDEFPNGRWGDTRSPAFGDFKIHGEKILYSIKDYLKIWGEPKNISDISQIFIDYCKGKIPVLPWCDSEIKIESKNILEQLIEYNQLGLFTISSQPCIDGIESNNPIFGWGPKNGFIYQKFYLEFFISPKNFKEFVNQINNNDYLTYYAVNKNGDFKSNCDFNRANVLTWGVFPGQEIIQSTIVEKIGFLTWKDEAFNLWNIWKNIYSSDSISYKLIDDIRNTWYLVNIVDNNYKSGRNCLEFIKN